MEKGLVGITCGKRFSGNNLWEKVGLVVKDWFDGGKSPCGNRSVY